MRRHARTLKLMLAGAVGLLGIGLMATPVDAQEDDFRLTASEARNYKVPPDFPLMGRLVRSTSDGTTLIANNVGQGADSTCTVVVASNDSAKAYPYQHSDEGTVCVGVLPHPDGGFFVRAGRAGAKEGDVFGVTARLDAKGNEKWLVSDTETAESDQFKGSYLQPHREMAFSRDTGYLLNFTLGKLTIGNLDEKNVTHVSVVRDGSMRVPAKTIGGGGGFGIIGGVATLRATGDFLLYIYASSTEGSHFYTYDGRESVDEFSPAEEDWSERFVRRMIYGPDDNIYLLWSDDRETQKTTRVTVVDDTETGIWSESYDNEYELDGETRSMGQAGNMWVGSRYIALLYQSSGPFLRIIETRNGEDLGFVPLEGVIDKTPLNLVRGDEGQLRLLAVDANGERFFEYDLGIDMGSEGGDAGLADAGGADATTGGNADDGGGCSTTGRRSGPLAPVAAWICLLVLGRLRAVALGTRRR